MSTPTPPPLDPAPKHWVVARWLVWSVLWLAGVVVAGVSAMHILADSHRWDARVSLPVRGGAAQASAPFRTLSGGAVNVFATSFVHGNAARAPFQGAIAIAIVDGNGTRVREFALGRGGVAHEQSTGSSWTTLGQVTAPRLWLEPWRLEARVVAADAAFPATHIEVMLRKERRDLGMGGMMYYVTIFIGLFLMGVATLLAIAWRAVIGNTPWIVSLAALAAVALLLGM